MAVGPLDQPPGVHHRDRVGDLDQQRQVVGDEQHREAEPLAQRAELLEDLPLGDHVQRGGRLVQDHHLRLQGQRHGDHHPLAHAAGQLVRVAAEPVGGDPDHAEQFAGPAGAGPGLQVRPVRLEHVGELGADGQHRVQCVHRGLQHHGDLRPAQPAQFRLVQGEQVHGPARLGVVEHLATGDHARRPEQPDRRVGQRGFAAPALPGQPEHLAAAQHQVHIHHRVHGVRAGSVVHPQAADVQQWLGGHDACSWAGSGLALAGSAPFVARTTGVRPSTKRRGSPGRPPSWPAAGSARPPAAGG